MFDIVQNSAVTRSEKTCAPVKCLCGLQLSVMHVGVCRVVKEAKLNENDPFNMSLV